MGNFATRKADNARDKMQIREAVATVSSHAGIAVVPWVRPIPAMVNELRAN
jgi:hypothetical protein